MNGFDTLAQINLFSDEIKDCFILHIPHSSANIPNLESFNLELIDENLQLLTDWNTDEIFDCDGVRKIITPFSRLFCDVERLDDDNEVMYKIGRGYFYTKDYLGRDLRSDNPELKKSIYNDYYISHHSQLKNEVDKVLELYGQCYIIDCHSFNDKPIGSINESPLSPDICLGIDEFHTPNYLLDNISLYLEKQGFSIEINNPYSGCIIPLEYYEKDKRVNGIMIEINKRLYMDDTNTVVNNEKVIYLKQIFNNFFNDNFHH